MASLLHREARGAGFTGGLGALLEALANLKRMVDLPAAGRQTPGLRLTKCTAVQEGLVHPFQLANYHAALSRTEG